MPTEPSNLRYLFDAPQPSHEIDVASVVRRSRARRVPKVLGSAGVSVLAIGGLFFGGFQLAGGVATTASDAGVSAEAGADAPMSTMNDESLDLKRAPAEKINLCGGQLAEVAPSQTGLVLTVHFADAPAGSASIEGTVTMTNTSDMTWNGYTAAAPAITLSQNNVVLWHTNGPMIELAREVALAPGESLEYAASFEPVVCSVEDDAAESFRADLPAAPAGEYQVSAAIDFMGELDAELVTGPAQTITLT